MPTNSKNRHKPRPRKTHEKKPIRPGVKSMRGQPEMYDELKKIVSVSITPTAKAGLAELSAARNISLSELIEQIGRQKISLSDPHDLNHQTSQSPESKPISLQALNNSYFDDLAVMGFINLDF